MESSWWVFDLHISRSIMDGATVCCLDGAEGNVEIHLPQYSKYGVGKHRRFLQTGKWRGTHIFPKKHEIKTEVEDFFLLQ